MGSAFPHTPVPSPCVAPHAGSQAAESEADLGDVWNADQSQYSFLYRSEEAPHARVMVKALPLDTTLLVNVLAMRDGAAPLTAELDIAHHCSGGGGDEAAALKAPLQDLAGLVGKVQAALDGAMGGEVRYCRQ